MSTGPLLDGGAGHALEVAWRTESRRVLATLIRLFCGDFDAAEEALHEAFLAAAERWPRDGVPTNPYAWLVSAGRFRTISAWRRKQRLAGALENSTDADPAPEPALPEHVADDELRLILTCCHPALPPDAQVALTLRAVCRLTTEEIARAYLVSTPVIAQRIVRAKARIREQAIPYAIPTPAELPTRLESALHVVYLIFNEGYVATSGPDLVRADLCGEAIRLSRLLVELVEDAEAFGLLALLLLHDARRETRVDAAGDLVRLADQDRTRWDAAAITEARALLHRALATRAVGPYVVQAAIADVHTAAPSVAETDWAEIVALYDVLRRVDPSPVVALNRAVAVGMRDDPEAGLAAVEGVLAEGGLEAYPLAYAARADLLRRLDRRSEAVHAYQQALALTRQPAERRFLERRIAEVGDGGGLSGGQ